MTDKARAYVRTAWPMLIGHVVAWIITATPIGDRIDSAFAFEAVGWLAAVAVYVAGVELERWPGASPVARYARAAGRFLLSLGLPIGRPTYQSR